MKVETTLLVDFGDIDPSTVVAVLELDSDRNVDSEGEEITSFAPGDPVYFRFSGSGEVVVTDVVATDGTPHFIALENRDIEETVTFASRDPLNPDKHTLQYVPVSGVTKTYYGRSGTLTHEALPNSTMILTPDIEAVPFHVKLEYECEVDSWLLETPTMTLGEDETYTIIIVVYIETESNNGCTS